MRDYSTTLTALPPVQEAIKKRCYHPSGIFAPFAKEDIEQSIPARFEKIVHMYPDRLAVKLGNNAVTYRELNHSANQIAFTILDREADSTSPVALLLANNISMISAILGVLKVGKIYVPLDPSFPASQLGAMLEDSQAQLIIINNRTANLAKQLAHSEHSILNLDQIKPTACADKSSHPINPHAYASIMYTSGSTGKPKGVVQTHRNILYKIRIHTNGYRISIEDRLSLLYSCSFSASLTCIFGALLNGASLFPFDVKNAGWAHLSNWLIREAITIYFSIPTLFRNFLSTLERDQRVPSVRLIYLGSEPVTARDVQLYKKYFSTSCILVNTMGAGETGTMLQNYIDAQTKIRGDMIPVGHAPEGTEVLVLDANHRKVNPGEIGELAVRSRYLSPGYWRQPDLTASRFLPDPQGSATAAST